MKTNGRLLIALGLTIFITFLVPVALDFYTYRFIDRHPEVIEIVITTVLSIIVLVIVIIDWMKKADKPKEIEEEIVE